MGRMMSNKSETPYGGSSRKAATDEDKLKQVEDIMKTKCEICGKSVNDKSAICDKCFKDLKMMKENPAKWIKKHFKN